MIKAVVTEAVWNDIEETILCDDPAHCPLEGAYLVEYEREISHFPSTKTELKVEARLDEEGKPFIYQWKEYTPYLDYADWCQDGSNHRMETQQVEGKEKRWKYFKTIKTAAWVMDILSLDHLKDLLKMKAVCLAYDNSLVPGYDFELRI